MSLSKQIEDAISFDEIGIATARHGSLVLRSAFQLIYALEGEELRAASVQGYVRPNFRGSETDASAFFNGQHGADRSFAENLAVSLHLFNHQHVEIEGLDHLIAVGSASAVYPATAEFIKEQALEAAAHSMTEPRIICSLVDDGDGAAAGIAEALTLRGFGLAIGSADACQPPVHTLKQFNPAIARFDGRWFQRIAADEGASRLLTHLVADLHDRRIAVLIDRIETPEVLFAAIDVGADYFKGYLLSRPQLAGVPVADQETLLLEDFRTRSAAILPFMTAR